MNEELKNYLVNLGIEKLMESELGAKLDQALSIF